MLKTQLKNLKQRERDPLQDLYRLQSNNVNYRKQKT